MTYQELLQSLADRAATNYTAYLQSKIDALADTSDTSLPEKTTHYQDEYQRLEDKFTAVLAMVKNGTPVTDIATDDVIEDTKK